MSRPPTGPRIVYDEPVPQPAPLRPDRFEPEPLPRALAPEAPAVELPTAEVPVQHGAPTILVEEPAQRLDLDWSRSTVPAGPPPRSRNPTLLLLGTGLALLVFGLSALDSASFVADQFARADWLGWLTLGVAVLGYGLVLAGIWREARGLFSLRAAERVRRAFRRGEHRVARSEVLRWAEHVPEAAPLRDSLAAAPDVDTLRGLLEAGPLATLDTQALALGRNAAMQILAATAVSPSSSLDAALVSWRGLRLVRQIAALHGMRPGLLGTALLLRRVAFDAAGVAGADIAIRALADTLLTSPLMGGLAGQAAGAAIAVRRMLRLAQAASAACRIVPKE